MIDFTDMLVFAGMLFLRFGVPLLVVIGIGYLLKRLDRRWEAEAWAEQAKAKAAEVPADAADRSGAAARRACTNARPCASTSVHPAASAPDAPTSAGHDGVKSFADRQRCQQGEVWGLAAVREAVLAGPLRRQGCDS